MTAVALEDIQDVRGFSAVVVRRVMRGSSPDELKEAIAEGVTLLYELHGKWDQERCASFYRFCTTYLQLRLIDWWRREARQRNLAHRSGDGGYVYQGRVSLDDLIVDDDEDDELAGKRDRVLVTVDSHRVGD